MQIPLNPLSPIALVTAALVGTVSAYFALKKGKNPYLWFAIGFFLGIIGIFAVLFFTAVPKNAPEKNPKEPVFCIDGPSDKFWYYLDATQKTQGPMSKDAMSSAWRSGKIDLSTFIWYEGLSEWKPLKEALREETAQQYQC